MIMVAQTGTENNSIERIATALERIADVLAHDDHEDKLIARIERVLKAHDSALYADVVSDRVGLAAAISAALSGQRNDLRIAQTVALSQRKEISALDDERTDLQSQLVQMDADNASLTKELTTLRSYVTAPGTWQRNDDGFYTGDCGVEMWAEVDIIDNDYHYCPNCGRPIAHPTEEAQP